jgi:hypothetical protein
LRVDIYLHVGPLPVKALLRIADFLHSLTCGLFHFARGYEFGPTNFPGQHDAVGGGERFHRYAAVRIVRKEQIDDGIRYTVADFIGMAFAHRFRREKEMIVFCVRWHNGPEANDGAPKQHETGRGSSAAFYSVYGPETQAVSALGGRAALA